MNQKQLDYCKTKTLVELLQEDRDRHMGTITMGETDASIDAYYDEQARYEAAIGYWEAVSHLRDTENEVIEWAKGVMLQEYPERYEQVRPAFDKGPGNIMIREKLVDICMRLNA